MAFEVSRQLQRRGCAPGGLILIDSPVPIQHEPLPADIISLIVGKSHTGAAGARSCIEAQFRRNARLLQSYAPPPEPDGALCIAIVCSQLMDTQNLCGRPYRWLSDGDSREKSLKDWEQLLGRELPVLELNCNHFEVFSPVNVSNANPPSCSKYSL